MSPSTAVFPTPEKPEEEPDNEEEKTSPLRPLPTTTTSTGIASSPSSFASTIHRVHTTGILHDDYITAKQLTPSAHQRLVKRFQQHLTTTEEHHSVAGAPAGFYGSYANIRKKLDYTYHVYYRKERQWLHDCIIEDCLLKHQQQDEAAQEENNDNNDNPSSSSPLQACCNASGTSSLNYYDYHQGTSVLLPKHQWLILMVGVHGAAKHCTIRKLIDAGRLPLLSLVCVDTDDLRRYLPEYATYHEESPDTVDRRTRKEAGYISETLALAALQAGRNVIFYCSLKDTAWYKHTFVPFYRQQFHGLKVALFHVTADPAVALERSRQRAAATRRPLDERAFLENLTNTIPVACQQLRDQVDYYGEICNNTRDGEANGDVVLQTDKGDWRIFTQTFDQRGRALSCSYPDRIIPPTPVVHTHHQRMSSIRKFCALDSSEDNHAADDMEFYGPFAAIRKSLDYSYHANYTFERQHFQDAIIREFLNASAPRQKGQTTCALPSCPWAVFTAGAMGAGKGYTIDYLVKKGRFPLMAVVKVNADEIRRYLPEYHLYVETNPDLAGDLTNKEAGYIAEILALAGLQSGKNILVDGSLRDASWYRNYFSRLRSEFPGLRLAIIHVTAPREAIFQRASERALQTGRIVPRDLIVETIQQVPLSVAELSPLVDYHIELLNDPKTADIEIVTQGETWESFTSQWVQTSRGVVPEQAGLAKQTQPLRRETERSAEEKEYAEVSRTGRRVFLSLELK